MIIKVSFNDNDFTQVIEDFINKFKSNVFMYDVLTLMDKYEYEENNGKYIDTSHEWRARNELIHKDNYTKDDIDKLIVAFQLSFKAYLKDMFENEYDYLADNLTVTSVGSIKDEWLNGEVVYYFPKHRDKYITM